MGAGKLFRSRREELNLSQSQVARMAGVTPSSVMRLEKGDRTGSADLVIKVANALAIPPVDVFTEFLEGEADRIVEETQRLIEERERRLARLEANGYRRHARESSESSPGGRRLAAALVAGAA